MPRGRHFYDPILQVPSRPEEGPKERIELYPEGDVTDAAPGPLRWVARLIGPDGRIVQYSPGSFDHDDAMRQAQEMWPGREIYELREESEDSTHEGFGPSLRLWQNTKEWPAGQNGPDRPGFNMTATAFPPANDHILTAVDADSILNVRETETGKWIGVKVHRQGGVLFQTEEFETYSDAMTAARSLWPDLPFPSADATSQLHALTVGQPGTYVRLDDVLALLEEYAGQFDEGGNPSAALGLREAASALREAF